jgi:esterase/lipase
LKKINPKKLLKLILFVVAVTIFADLSYSIYIRVRLKIFKNSVQRDSEGYLTGSAPLEAGKGENAILFVHGFNDSPALWKTWVPFFAENGFYCLAIRLSGSSYDLDAKKDITIAARVEQIKNEYDELRKTHENVILCSHSMGGAYSAAIIASNQIAPDILVLVAPMFGVSSKKSPILSPESWFRIGSKITLFTDTVENIITMDIKDKSVIPDYPINPFIPMSLYDTLFDLMDVCSTNAQQIKIPTIFMVAEHDTVINTGRAIDYYNNISSKHKVMIVDENSGHVIPRDFDNQIQAELLLENINKFLEILRADTRTRREASQK